MSARRASLGSLVVTTAGVCVVVSAVLVVALLIPPLLWTFLLASVALLSFELIPVRTPEPVPVARTAPPTETAPRSPPLV